MNRLSVTDRTQIVSALVEGSGINATCRMTGISKPTVLKLLSDLGRACYAYHDAHVRGLHCKRVQCDEIWEFIGAKMKNASEEKVAQGWGDSFRLLTQHLADCRVQMSSPAEYLRVGQKALRFSYSKREEMDAAFPILEHRRPAVCAAVLLRAA